MLKPTGDKDMEVFVDADFSGNWDGAESHNRDTARSRHGHIIMHAGCPVSWKSQLQTETALSSTRSVLRPKRCHINDGVAKGNEETRFPNLVNSSKDAL
jgi:hypothetical protein